VWRDLLIILAFALAVLAYFGITPGRVLGYATAVKADIAKRRPQQRAFLFWAIGLTVAIAYFGVVLVRREKQLFPSILLPIILMLFLWGVTLHDVWKLSERGEKILSGLMRFGMMPLVIVTLVFSDMPLWQKIAYPVGGFFAGMGARKLTNYISRRRKMKEASKG
jgi:hypothetical protein